jgi:hypothetical protein
MKIAILALVAAASPPVHHGWDIIAEWHGPGWYAEIDGLPVMGPFATKRECRAERFETPSTCLYIKKEADFPEPMPLFPEPPPSRL